MRKMKFLLWLVLFITLSSISSPSDSIAEQIDAINKPSKETTIIMSNNRRILNNGKYSCCDPKMLVPGNPDIDPKMLVPGNPNIDLKMLIKYNTDKDVTKQAPDTDTNSVEQQPFTKGK